MDTRVVESRQREAIVVNEFLVQLPEHYPTQSIHLIVECRIGNRAQELLAVAADDDLHITASPQRSGVSRWSLGSLAEEILRHTWISVIVVRVQTSAPRLAAFDQALRGFTAISN